VYLKADIFSLGVTFWQIISGEPEPYPQASGANVMQLVFRIQGGMRPIVARSFPQQYGDLLQKCWSGVVSERPSAEIILQKFDSFGDLP